MTFYEWIRRCLLWDAERHPMPDAQKEAFAQKLSETANADCTASTPLTTENHKGGFQK